MIRSLFLSLLITTALNACGNKEASPPPRTTQERLALPPDSENGRKQFRACAVCHNAGKGAAARLGPTLWGMYNSPAAAQPGFVYSKALQRAELIWDEDTLDAWLLNGQKLVPGNRMQYVGEPDKANRRDLIAYLKTLHEKDINND